MTVMAEDYMGNIDKTDPLAILLRDINSAKSQSMAANTMGIQREQSHSNSQENQSCK